MRTGRPPSVEENRLYIQEIIDSCNAEIQIVAVNRYYWGHFAGVEPGSRLKYYSAFDRRNPFATWIGPKGSIRHEGEVMNGEIGSNLVRVELFGNEEAMQLSLFDLIQFG